MKRWFKSILMVLICLLFVSSFLPSKAEGEEEDGTVYLTSSYYVITAKEERSLRVPFNKNWFRGSAAEYDHRLAQLSLGLATSAFRPNASNEEKEADENLMSFLSQAGFTDLRSDDYDKHPSMYTVSTVMGHQTIGEGDEAFELVAVGVCGQGYMNEWESNFSIGSGEIPDGFSRSAQLVYDRVFGYIAQNHISGKVKVWMSGFSRAAAITNITSAWLTDSAYFGPDNVFAYTFGTPRTTRGDNWDQYPNIFNICGKMDPVTCVPFADWGYERFGVTLYTPCQEADSDFMAKRLTANRVYYEITGINYWSNPMMNTQIRNIMSYFLKICPTVDVYVNSLQDNFIELWEKHDPVSVITKLVEMSEDPLLINEENRHEANMFLNYLTYILMDYLTQDYAFRRYNDKASLASNMAQAHTPEFYVSWIYASDDPEECLSSKMNYTQMVLEGEDMNVELFREGKLLESVSTKDKEGGKTLLFMTQSENKVTILIPRDYRYSLHITADSRQTITSCSAQYRIGHQKADEIVVHELEMDKDGSCTMTFPVGTEIWNEFVNISAKISDADYDLLDSGSGIVAFERRNMLNLSWKHIVFLVLAVPIILVTFLLFMLASLINHLRFARMRRKGYIPKTMRFRPLPIFCTLFIVQAFLIEEVRLFLDTDFPEDLRKVKIIIGVLTLIIAFYGYRRKKDLFHGLLMAAVVLLSAADCVIIDHLKTGAVLHILAYLFLSGIFIYEERMDLRQIIAFLILSALGIFLILRIPGEYGILRILAIVYTIASCLMVTTAFPLSRRYFRGAVLLFISGILLIYNQVNGQTALSHFISLGMYYIAVVTLASSGSGVVRPKMVPVTMLEELRNSQGASE